MIYVPIRRTRLNQPNGDGIDWLTSPIKPKYLWLSTESGAVDLASNHSDHSATYNNGGVILTAGKLGNVIQGSGSVSGSATGFSTAIGKGSAFGQSAITMFAFVKFTNLLSSNEAAIYRRENPTNTNLAQYALDVFPNTGKVRGLISTSGTTGWTVSSDVTTGFTADIPALIMVRWAAGSVLQACFAPVGTKPVWGNSSVTPTGTINVLSSGADSGLAQYIGGMANTAGASFPGEIAYSGVLPYRISDQDAEKLAKYPWSIFL